MARKWKMGDLFKGLIQTGNPSAQPEEDAPVEMPPAPTPAVPEETPETEAVENLYIDVQGPLLELWKKFNSDELTPGRMPMLNDEKLAALHPTKQKFELERLHLAAQLETDTKKRLDEIRHAQERENKALDAICRVYVSKDKLIAWCFAFPPCEGGEELSSAMVGMALEKAGVKVGIDPQGMVAIFQEPRYLRLVPMAFGEPPVEGEDGQITENFPRELTREVVVDEHGIADYRAMNYVQIIKKGSVICDITPPVKGTPGTRLDGKPIPPRSVQMPKVPRGVNTTLSEDGCQLLATMDGHLEYSNGAFHVRPVLEIHGDVDYKTGNIDFIGDVQITGDVRENFSVRATGSITVDGIVEGATVNAGGDLTITRGVVGDGHALLKCRGVFRVKYVENSQVYAGGSVYADCIMTSHVFSDQAIEVTDGHGSVIGGTLTAGEAIRANTIGAQSGRRTELTLGVLPYTEGERKELADRVHEVEHEIETLQWECKQLEGKEPAKAAEKRGRLPILQLKASRLAKKYEELKEREADITKCRFECGTVYPMTFLELGPLKWSTDQIRRQCKIIYDEESGALRELS